MLILASLSGIQDFLFDVRETGGGQARSLRHRSFRIQMFAECAALRLLEAAGLGRDRLIFCAAAKLAIDARGAPEASVNAVRATAEDMARSILSETHGRLRFSAVVQPFSDDFASTLHLAECALRRAKLRPFAPPDGVGAWGDGDLVVQETWDPDREADRDAALGRDLVGARWLTIEKPAVSSPSGGIEALGLRVRLRRDDPTPSPTLVSCSNLVEPEVAPAGVDLRLFHKRRLARHVPRNDRGEPVEFLELAGRSRGAAMLGVLKADVDSLSLAFRAAGGEAQTLGKLSDDLDRFFAGTLEAEKERPDSRWADIYTVFSGGDDMLAVGPWNVMLDFAGHIRLLFDRAFGAGARNPPSRTPLTISAGVAIVKPRFPVHLAAGEAGDLLDVAKDRPAPGAASAKDQCAALGDAWKWAEHEAVLSEGRKLADWVGAGVIERGWLHTVLELALLRRGNRVQQPTDVPPAAATSRLAYHARKWPPVARPWIESVIEHFDTAPGNAPVHVRFLPAIARYAMLATRAGRKED